MTDFFLGLLSGLLGIVWAEFNDCMPWLTKKILAKALKAVPEARRERDAEEWAAILADTPGKIWPLITACGFWWGVSKERVRHAMSVGAFEMGSRALDIAGALTFFAVFGPIYLVVALCVLISMGRPVHFWQNRIGKDGKHFRFYKFRSMVHNSEDVLDEFLLRNDMARTEWETFQMLEQDPRITPVGQFIRKLSLDELPQFWNVLKGDMSLVGPRPCMKRQRQLYGKSWKYYCAVRPGITGLWQVSGRNRLSYANRIQLDEEYVKNRSFWLNIKILLWTVGAVITGDGSREDEKRGK